MKMVTRPKSAFFSLLLGSAGVDGFTHSDVVMGVFFSSSSFLFGFLLHGNCSTWEAFGCNGSFLHDTSLFVAMGLMAFFPPLLYPTLSLRGWMGSNGGWVVFSSSFSSFYHPCLPLCSPVAWFSRRTLTYLLVLRAVYPCILTRFSLSRYID